MNSFKRENADFVLRLQRFKPIVTRFHCFWTCEEAECYGRKAQLTKAVSFMLVGRKGRRGDWGEDTHTPWDYIFTNRLPSSPEVFIISSIPLSCERINGLALNWGNISQLSCFHIHHLWPNWHHMSLGGHFRPNLQHTWISWYIMLVGNMLIQSESGVVCLVLYIPTTW